MDWYTELFFAARMLYAALLGALVGYERERDGCEAGIRTFAAVSFGSCAFSLISLHVVGGDPTRIAAQVVTGIGFIGAGVILQVKGRTSGLTTAATVWACASVGMASAFGMYLLALLTALLLFCTLYLHHLPIWRTLRRRRDERRCHDEERGTSSLPSSNP
ncbi:MAG: MgtC/SapB family protein [Pseudomonadota bacterium]